MHAALDRLYKERPGADPLPRPGSLDAWVARGRALVAELAAERGFGEHPAELAMVHRVERLLARFLAEEAERETGGFEPWLLEASFGEQDDSERPVLDLGGWGLHGAIDRVDRDPGGRALVLDYKLSGAVTPRGKFEERAKLQLPLYLIAVAEHWKAEPVAGLYHPLRATSARRPRGFVLDEAAEGLASYGLYEADVVGSEEFEAVLEESRERASKVVARMRTRRHPPRPRPAAGPARPRHLPLLLRVRPDLPPRPGAGERGRRGGGGAVSRHAPTPEQEAAIRISGRDVLLEAGAGTGKTGVMVDRYCRLVCDEGASPDAVLAFTFTDKAAAELRQRIAAELAARAEAGSERARALLGGIGAAWVTTIHGFCNRLLAGHPVAAGIDPRFRVLDAPEAERAAREAFDEALEDFLAEGRGSPPGRDRRRARGRRPACAHRRPPRGAAQPWRRRAAAAGAASARSGGGDRARGRGRRRDAGGAEPERPQAGAARESALRAHRQRRRPAVARPAGRAADRQQGEEHDRLPRGDRRRGRPHRRGRRGRDCLPPHRAAPRALLHPLRGGQGPPRRDRLRGPADPRRPPAGTNRDRRRLPLALQPPAGRRVPGHQPTAASPDRGPARPAGRADGRRRRVPVDIRLSPRRPRRLPPAATGSRREPRRRVDGAERQLPLAAGGGRRGQRDGREAARRQVLPPAARRRDARRRRSRRRRDPGRAAAHRPQRLGCGGDRPGTRDRRGARHSTAWPRLAPSPSGCDSWPTSGSTAARWSCCCGRSPISTPTRTRWSGPACAPTSSAAAATGPSSRSPTSARCWRRSPTRSTTRRCSAPSPRPPAASPPTRSGCCGRQPASGAASGRRSSGSPASATPSWPSRSGWSRSPRAELALLRRFAETVAGLRERGTRLSLAALVDAAVTETGYDLAVLMRPAGEARFANVRKLMRLAAEFEAREGRDLRGLLDFLACPRRDRRRRPGGNRGRGARRRADHDRPQRQGARVRRRRGARPLAQPAGRVAAAACWRSAARRSPGSACSCAGWAPARSTSTPTPSSARSRSARDAEEGLAALLRRRDTGARAPDPQRCRQARARQARRSRGRR